MYVTDLHLQPGGNAGMAAAYSGRQLGVPTTIVVPSVTPVMTVERLRDEGATVIIHGKVCVFLLYFYWSISL